VPRWLDRQFDRIRQDDPDWSPWDVLYPAVWIVAILAGAWLLGMG
jgi:tryptophan-rich sensory protein